ncbi:hypothetical protein [Metamycoplasma buccale]|uniref:hypothetical protein n=1 Tax=Metamycoplasma buccale TaxID=55602 RepID=UPI00398ED3A8
MKGRKSLCLLSNLISISLISPLVVSCARTKEYKTLKLNNTYDLPLQDFNKVGKLFDKKVTRNVKNKKTGAFEDATYSYWEWLGYAEAKITHWRDGDTFDAEITKAPFETIVSSSSLKVGDKIAVRIPTIDTLEEHGSNVSEKEKELAKLDHAYAEKLIPVGTTVRLLSSNWANKSYDRHIANAFFGENFEQNFATSMLAGGYTLPRIGDDVKSAFRDDYQESIKNSIYGLLLPYLAYAYNWGIENKKGFYEKHFKNPYEFSKAYESHGEMINSGKYILSQAYSQDSNIDFKNNIFKFIEKMNKK